MFVIVEHRISDPTAFWSLAKQGLPKLPANLKLHHCFPTDDGTKAVCVWEAASVQDVEGFFEGRLNQVSSNKFYSVVNKEGVALPPRV